MNYLSKNFLKVNNNLTEKKLREELVSAARSINSIGLNHGTSGNLSSRIKGGLLITPSSIPYEEMQSDDLVAIDLNGNSLVATQRQPSSEWRLHVEILRKRPEIKSIVHCHSIHATALSCHERSIPSFHYMTAIAGGNNIRCTSYATFGTKELSQLAVAALENRLACLLGHHGLVTLGVNFKAAIQMAIEVETLAHTYLQACQLGEPPLLSNAEMIRVNNKFKRMSYRID